MFLFVGGDDQLGLSGLRLQALDFRLGLRKDVAPAVLPASRSSRTEHARGRAHSKNMMMYWLIASSAPAAHPSTNTTSRIIIGGLRSGGLPEQPQN
jgi:hypothetical protein